MKQLLISFMSGKTTIIYNNNKIRGMYVCAPVWKFNINIVTVAAFIIGPYALMPLAIGANSIAIIDHVADHFII